ncbi:ClpXP protease specificity-enhancing factor [Ferrimonas marina]|uniref:Stringent starvation protein B n=1 Tax=Ferrimonas marina TaxID=299255 RepID=A0A1M5Y2H5_9GAMM|nr:ClpXP protease specificity-enhancing factor [Ferrimonas marina]SHI06295.1 stringent starvation protein B [Ferrimonas marina]
MSQEVSPTRPYLLRAFYDWMLDNDLTPHLVVNAEVPGVQVPRQFIQDGQIVLNIAPHAVGNLQLGNDFVLFNARFGGKPHALNVPMEAVEAIYARENGAGTVFPPEPAYEDSSEEPEETVEEAPEASEPATPPTRPSGRPTLKVIK